MRSIKNVKSIIWGMIYVCTIQAYDWREGRSMGVGWSFGPIIAQVCRLWLIDQCGHYDRIVFVT